MIVFKHLSYTLPLALIGCSQSMGPSHQYNVNQPSQVAMDQLLGTRHYVSVAQLEDLDQFSQMNHHRNNAFLSAKEGYEQLLISSGEISIEKKNHLEHSLSRTCWSIKEDAKIELVSTSFRGVSNTNNMHACISKRLGREYPLFVFSYVRDEQVGTYFMMVSPRGLYSDNKYLCKTKREGYNYKTTLYCN